jgi:hypothetical protein
MNIDINFIYLPVPLIDLLSWLIVTSTVLVIPVAPWSIYSSLPVSLSLSGSFRCLTSTGLSATVPVFFDSAGLNGPVEVELALKLSAGISSRREMLWWVAVGRERDGSVLSKPFRLRARRSGRMVISEAAVMAIPGSIRVHTMAVVPLYKRSEESDNSKRYLSRINVAMLALVES